MGHDDAAPFSAVFVILLVLSIIIPETCGQVFIIRSTTLVYTTADTPIETPSESPLNTRSCLIGGLSSAQKKIIKMTVLNHFQVVARNYEKVCKENGVIVYDYDYGV